MTTRPLSSMMKPMFYGAFAATLAFASTAATAMPVAAPATRALAEASPAVQPEKVYWCRYHRCYHYGYRRYYPRYYGYRYYHPYVGVRVPFLHFGIY